MAYCIDTEFVFGISKRPEVYSGGRLNRMGGTEDAAMDSTHHSAIRLFSGIGTRQASNNPTILRDHTTTYNHQAAVAWV